MKKVLLNGLIVMGAVLSIVGCDSSTDAPLVEDVTPPTSELSQELKDSITYMYNEEGLAHDVYLAIYKIQPVNQLQNIANNSETKHIEAVNKLAIQYDLNITQYPDTEEPYSIAGIKPGIYPVEKIQDLYHLLYDKGIQSKQDALEVGCMVEVVDIDDLDKYIEYAEKDNASDVLDVFTFLRNGSYTHYWAFNDGLVNKGITDGCCSLGTEWCHPEYPKK